MAAISATITSGGERLHEVSIPLDASKNAAERPVGAVEDVLDALKEQVNSYLSERVDEERAALGIAAADNDGWHELNEEGGGGGGDSEDELDAMERPKRGKGKKAKRERQ